MIKIINRDKEYNVHKIILTYIPYFDKLFNSDFQEKDKDIIKIGYKKECWEELIESLYKRKKLLRLDNCSIEYVNFLESLCIDISKFDDKLIKNAFTLLSNCHHCCRHIYDCWENGHTVLGYSYHLLPEDIAFKPNFETMEYILSKEVLRNEYIKDDECLMNIDFFEYLFDLIHVYPSNHCEKDLNSNVEKIKDYPYLLYFMIKWYEGYGEETKQDDGIDVTKIKKKYKRLFRMMRKQLKE